MHDSSISRFIPRLLRESTPWVVARETRRSLGRLREAEVFGDKVRLRPHGTARGRALLSYFTGPHRVMERDGVLGNGFTMGTYRYAGKPMVPVPILPAGDPAWPEGKDFDACRKRFLWFVSGGLVRKGLDLVLEAFARLPEFHLTVCGPLDGDPDFVRAFRKELFETPNIRSTGWVDTGSDAFADICRNSLALVYPSCAEGQCGGVITTMQAGVIPVVSRESGVDVDGFGMVPATCSVDNLVETVETIAQLPAARLEEMARAARDHALRHHRPRHFLDRYRGVISRFVDHRNEASAVVRAAAQSRPRSPMPFQAYGHAIGVG